MTAEKQPKKRRARRGRGEGSIKELPSGKFRVVVSAGKDSSTGKRLKVTATFDTKREALDWRAEKLREQGKGGIAHAGKLTVGEFLADWLQRKKPSIEPNSWDWYEKKVRLHLTPTLGALLLSKVAAMDVERMHTKLTEAGLSQGEQRAVAVCLRVALKDAVKKKLIPVNPALDVTRQKGRKRDHVSSLTEEQVVPFLAACRGRRLEALWVLAIDSGMRPGELYGLHWPEVDLVAGTVKVIQSLEELKGQYRLKTPKTEKSRRTIPIGARAVQALKAHGERMQAEGRDVDRGPVFVNVRGGWLGQSNVNSKSFKPILKAAGLPSTFRPYDMRHTCATLLLSRDVNVRVVSERLGHEDIQTTLRFYAHALPNMQARAVQAINDLLPADCPTTVP